VRTQILDALDNIRRARLARLQPIAGVAICVAALAVAGCGAATSGGAAATGGGGAHSRTPAQGVSTAPGGTGASARATPASKVAVTITIRIGHGMPKRWTLRCQPAGGTHPDPAAACKALFAVKDPFAPQRHRLVCPMIMANAEQATISGTWFGHKVHRIVIDGGCDVGLWTELHTVFR
jgi:hypothetical protein